MKRRKTGGRAQWRREGEGEHTVKLRNQSNSYGWRRREMTTQGSKVH